ncbi:hypothetical protein EDB19DRAFT_1838710 [Suillus lakei]|nr:hypothetical protein EDB19DRAFT_1838710 [Suillus lakei]
MGHSYKSEVLEVLSNIEKHMMPGSSWMTHKQTVWLKSKMDGFCLSQLQGSVSAYLNQLCLECNCALTVIEECLLLFTKTITKLMATSTARTHGPTTVEHFLQMDYKEDSSIKEEVMAQVENEASKVMATRSEAYVMQMEEQVKAECQRRTEKAKCELEGLWNPLDSLKLQYIEGLGGVAGQLLETIFETTGWHGSIYLGGPDPCANGDICVFSFHHGKGSTGFTFHNSLPNHTKWIVEPFTMFLKGAFATSATSAPPEVLQHIDVFSGVDTSDLTPLTFDPTPLTEARVNAPPTPVQEPSTSDSVPIVEGGAKGDNVPIQAGQPMWAHGNKCTMLDEWASVCEGEMDDTDETVVHEMDDTDEPVVFTRLAR